MSSLATHSVQSCCSNGCTASAADSPDQAPAAQRYGSATLMRQRMKYLAVDDLVTPGRQIDLAWAAAADSRRGDHVTARGLSGWRPGTPASARIAPAVLSRPAACEMILTTGRRVNGGQNRERHSGAGRQRWLRGRVPSPAGPIDTVAYELTANDTSLRFLGEAARAGRRQAGTALAHSCSPARNTLMGQPHPQAMPGPAARTTFGGRRPTVFPVIARNEFSVPCDR